jgi:hypothetical protein
MGEERGGYTLNCVNAQPQRGDTSPPSFVIPAKRPPNSQHRQRQAQPLDQQPRLALRHGHDDNSGEHQYPKRSLKHRQAQRAEANSHAGVSRWTRD